MAEVSNSKLLQIDAGIPDRDACIVIVRTEWNEAVVSELEAGCKKILGREGLSNIKTITVPGAVPSVIHSSVPSVADFAERKALPLKGGV